MPREISVEWCGGPGLREWKRTGGVRDAEEEEEELRWSACQAKGVEEQEK